MKARIYNPCTKKYIYFDYSKVEEIDKKYEDEIPEEDLKAIREWKERLRRREDEEI